MLQSMRDKTQGWLTWIIVIVICVMFGLWGISYYLQDMVSNKKSVAKVDGVSISQTDYNRLYQNLSSQQNPEKPLPAKQLQQQAMQQLVRQQVLLAAAKKAGMTISQAEVDQLLYRIPSLQDKGQFSVAKYHALLEQLGMSQQSYRSS